MVSYTSPLAIPFPDTTDTLKAALVTIIPALASQVDDLIAGLSAVAPVAWTDLAPGTGWAHVSGSEKIQYARASNWVGVAIAGTKASFSGGDVIATLPVGFRPSRIIRWAGVWAGAIRSGAITTAGQIQADAGTGGITAMIAFPL